MGVKGSVGVCKSRWVCAIVGVCLYASFVCVCVSSCVGTPMGLFVCGCQCDWVCVRLIVGNGRTTCEPVYVGVWHSSVSLWVTVVCAI